jgi:hypothetical protein
MTKRVHKGSLQANNMKRLRNMGLPTDLFSAGFWEREAEAKKREAVLLVAFEAMWKAGDWDHLSLPFAQIIRRWKAEIASPMHFASIGPNPRWVPVLGDAVRDWRRHTSGGYRTSWREYRRKQITKERGALGKRPPKWRV